MIIELVNPSKKEIRFAAESLLWGDGVIFKKWKDANSLIREFEDLNKNNYKKLFSVEIEENKRWIVFRVLP